MDALGEAAAEAPRAPAAGTVPKPAGLPGKQPERLRPAEAAEPFLGPYFLSSGLASPGLASSPGFFLGSSPGFGAFFLIVSTWLIVWLTSSL